MSTQYSEVSPLRRPIICGKAAGIAAAVATTVILGLALTTVAWAETAPAAASTISHHTFASASLGRDYAYNLYLPDGYAESNQRYPVLYLLHGSGGSEHDWFENGQLKETADRLIAAGSIPPAIVVMPGNRSWWIDGHNEPAETAFFSDLIPTIEKTWRVRADRGGRLLAGLSAGGFATVRYALGYPGMFAAGAALSPASYVPLPPAHSSAWRHAAFVDAQGRFDAALWQRLSYPQQLDAYKAQVLVVPLYINSGDHDTFDIAYHGAVLFQVLREHQPEAVEFRVVDGDHDWSVWAGTLPDALVWLFGYVQAE